MPHDHHDQLSPSGHPYRADDDVPLTYWQTLEIAVRELLQEKKVLTASEINAQIDLMDARSPANGAKVVARYWSDTDFARKLLEDGSKATREMGFDIGPMRLIALPNTEKLHNVVVCTLCSCYPRNLLGFPPDWYKSRAYRSRTVREPRKVLSEFGVELDKSVEVRVHDSTADMRYIVIPNRPKGTEGWSQNQLAELVTRDSMIGTGILKLPNA